MVMRASSDLDRCTLPILPQHIELAIASYTEAYDIAVNSNIMMILDGSEALGWLAVAALEKAKIAHRYFQSLLFRHHLDTLPDWDGIER